MIDVFGIGNPVVDAIVKVDDKHVLDFNLKKGSMHLVDEKTSAKYLEQLKDKKVLFVPGGDVVNTLTGIANLGGTAIFCGKVGVDEFGLLLEETMTKDNVRTLLVKSSEKTGSCISLVTPDQERTFVVHLGAAITLKEEEIIVEDIKNSKILYVTGYVLEDSNLRKMALKALEEAKKHDKRIAIDVSDPSLVERCKDDLTKIIKQYADIVLANEEEAFALTGKKREEAVKEMGKMASIAIVKVGPDGSYIMDGSALHRIQGYPAQAIDSSGAGDMFAAGFLFGITNGYNVKESGLIGSFAGSKVVELLGSRLDGDLKQQIKDFIKNSL